MHYQGEEKADHALYQWFVFCFLFFLLLDIFFIYISNVNIPFPGLPSGNPPHSASMRVLPHPPISAFQSWHSPTLGHRTPKGPRAAPSTDVQQGHPLPQTRPEPWVPPCVLFGWWSSPWELLGVWPVDTVAPPWGCKPPQLLQSFIQLLHWGPCDQSNG